MKPERRAPRKPSVTREIDPSVLAAHTRRTPLLEADEAVAEAGGVLRIISGRMVAFSPSGEAVILGAL